MLEDFMNSLALNVLDGGHLLRTVNALMLPPTIPSSSREQEPVEVVSCGDSSLNLVLVEPGHAGKSTVAGAQWSSPAFVRGRFHIFSTVHSTVATRPAPSGKAGDGALSSVIVGSCTNGAPQF